MLFSSLYFFSGTLSCEMREGPFRSVRAASRFFPPTTEKRNSNAFFFFSFLLPTGTGNTSGPGTRNHKKEQPKMGTHKGYTKIPRTKEHENEKKRTHTQNGWPFFCLRGKLKDIHNSEVQKPNKIYSSNQHVVHVFFIDPQGHANQKMTKKNTKATVTHPETRHAIYTTTLVSFLFQRRNKDFFIYEKTTMMPANMFRPSERKKSNGQRTENQSREYVNKKLLF